MKNKDIYIFIKKINCIGCGYSKMQLIEKENYKLYLGDCLEVMDKLIEEGVKVDCILTDPPYGITKCKWDVVIPFDEMWSRLNKLIKPNGAIVLFGSQPFTSELILSNIKKFKYQLIWNKKITGCPVVANRRPLPIHEEILVFGNGKINYNPIKTNLDSVRKWKQSKNSQFASIGEGVAIGKNPVSILEFSNAIRKGRVHPTQKPVALLEYLIKTYTNENEIVLDFTMGSGSTGVACVNTNRKFIGIELDEKYFNIATSRIEKTYIQNNSTK